MLRIITRIKHYILTGDTKTMVENMQKIEHSGKEYARIIDGNNLGSGLSFYTEDEKFVQVGSWKYDAGHVTAPHSHKVCERVSTITQEFVYVKKGSLEVTLYAEDESVIGTYVVKEGQAILVMLGGHSYHILEDGTEVFEVKNGPYPGIEKDKEVISDE